MGGRLPTPIERFGAFWRRNWPRLAIDAVALTSWMIVATEALRLAGVLRWLQYIVVFFGVIAYVYLTPDWKWGDPPVG